MTESEVIRDKAVKWNNNSSKRVPYEFIDYVEGKREICVSDYVCEWKSDCHLENDNPAEWLISPHEPKKIFSTDIKYCPYCGKKIKVVE